MKKMRRWHFLSGLSLCLASTESAATAIGGLTSEDSLALVQRSSELREHVSERGSVEAVASGHQRMASSETLLAAEAAIHGLGTMFADELKAFEVEQEGELQGVREVHAYVEGLRSTLGRRGTLFGELLGLAPAGRMSEADERMLARLLLPFRSKQFVAAVATGLKSISTLAPALVWRSERHLASLIHKSAQSDSEELRGLLVDFFKKEHHVLQSMLDAVRKALLDAAASVPGRSSAKDVWAELLDKLMQRATENLALTMDGIPADNFASFCGKGALDVFIIDQVLPMLGHTASALPRLGDFAASKAPDVAPQVSEAAKWLSEIVGTFVTSLEGEASLWAEKVCGLAGAAAAS